ncbi:Organic cation transporter protein [Nymphon striatum]|nr:Organic cation transporter protein [Nymphon striatum]
MYNENCMESLSSKGRGVYGAILSVIWCGGMLVITGVSYFTRDWVYTQIISAILVGLYFLFVWATPESPSWLFTVGRFDDGMKSLKSAARMNGKIEPEDSIIRQEIEDSKTPSNESATFFDLLRYPNLRKKTLILYYNWFVVSFIYFALTLNTGDLGGDLFLNMTIASILEAIGYVVAIFLLVKIGRRLPTAFCFIISGISCFLVAFIPDVNESVVWLKVAIALVGRTTISICFNNLFVYTSELHPTVVRTIGLGSSSMVARVGGMLAPYVKELEDGICHILEYDQQNRTRDNVTVKPDKVGYLPTINAPATELSTVQELLSQSVFIQQHLSLDKIAVIMDQALYAKAAEVAWKHTLRFESLLLMMGNFHIICNMLSIIGKLFRDAGLRDLAVESGVIAEGSIDKVPDGKQYNRGVQLHKLTYEALMRLVWKGFLEWLENNHSTDLPHLDETFRVVMAMHGDTCATTLESSRNEESCQRILHLLCCYLNVLKNDSGHLAAFWMIYLEMVEILLGLIRADREGAWYLHLASIKSSILVLCFAMDKTNYSRYLPVYYAQMTQLEQTCPDL